jgi:hypothetical protein
VKGIHQYGIKFKPRRWIGCPWNKWSYWYLYKLICGSLKALVIECIWNNSIMENIDIIKIPTMPSQAEEEENRYDFWTQQAERHLQRRERDMLATPWNQKMWSWIFFDFVWCLNWFGRISPFFLMSNKFFYPVTPFFSIKWRLLKFSRHSMIPFIRFLLGGENLEFMCCCVCRSFSRFALSRR